MAGDSVELTQRHLVNRRIRLADAEVMTKYAFPFWNREWRVVLALLDRFGAPPATAASPIHLGPGGQPTISMSSRDLQAAAHWKPETFQGLFHYDPWWVFRGIGGVPDEVKRTILPTNISKPFRHEKHAWKVHDVIFDADGGRVVAVVAKDDVFHTREFTERELHLDDTWPRAETRRT